MGIMRDILTTPLSWIYGLGVSFRHTLFNWKILKSEEFDIPIVSVGNITVGGTGKTPHTEYLIQVLSARYNVAVLSRGYKRTSKGFQLAAVNSSFKRIGDEPKQIKLKFPHIPVAVCEKRAEGIHRLREIHPEVNLIILDDAFQHRYVEPWVNIVLMDFHCPIYEDKLLPRGRLRDRKNQIDRSQIILVTKCPKEVRPLDFMMVRKNLDLYPYQNLYFTRFESDVPQAMFPSLVQKHLKPGDPVVALSAIANPRHFLDNLKKNYDLIHQMIFRDHYAFRMKDIYHLEDMLKSMPPETMVVLTEKDAVKLLNSRKISDNIKRRLYYVPISVRFVDGKEPEFQHQLEQYVRENQKYNILHP